MDAEQRAFAKTISVPFLAREQNFGLIFCGGGGLFPSKKQGKTI